MLSLGSSTPNSIARHRLLSDRSHSPCEIYDSYVSTQRLTATNIADQ
jgi:hypothetical protein